MQHTCPFDQTALVRCALMRCAPDRYTFVISHHHLLTDGWSFSLLLQEVMAFYQAARHGESIHLTDPRPYHDYIAWVGQQDRHEAERFWQRILQGRQAPTPLPQAEPTSQLANQPTNVKRHAAQSCTLSADLSSQLQTFARRNNLTTNTLVQGAVALLLSHLSGDRDIVYGVTFAGRPPELPGVDAIMGLLIHSLPLRVPIAEHRPLLPWLEKLLQTQVEIEPYSYTPLHAIQTWCNHSQPLFHCNLRFQNFPMDDGLRQRWSEDLTISNATMVDWWHYPLNIVVTPGAALNLTVTFDTRMIDESRVSCWLAGLARVLTSFVEQPQAPLAAHLAVLG